MAACCGLVYYCVNGEIVTQEPGPAPAGFSGGPWATLAEAQAGCPFSLQCCGGYPIPAAIWGNITNKTGWAVGRLPNSFPCPWTTASGGYYIGSFYDTAGSNWGLSTFPYCNLPTPYVYNFFSPDNALLFSAGAAYNSTPISPYFTGGAGRASNNAPLTCAPPNFPIFGPFADFTFFTTALGNASFRVSLSP